MRFPDFDIVAYNRGDIEAVIFFSDFIEGYILANVAIVEMFARIVSHPGIMQEVRNYRPTLNMFFPTTAYYPLFIHLYPFFIGFRDIDIYILPKTLAFLPTFMWCDLDPCHSLSSF